MKIVVAVLIYFGVNVALIIISDWVARKRKAALRWSHLPLGEKIFFVLLGTPLLIIFIVSVSTCPKIENGEGLNREEK